MVLAALSSGSVYFIAASNNRLVGGCDSPEQTGNNDHLVKFLSISEELLVHKEHLECHCAGVVKALEKERAKFLKFCDQQNNMRENLHSQIRDMEAAFLSASAAEK